MKIIFIFISKNQISSRSAAHFANISKLVMKIKIAGKKRRDYCVLNVTQA